MAEMTVNQSSGELPTKEQIMRLACTKVEHWLSCGINAACGAGWREELINCVNAADLARMTTERLRNSLPTSRDDFEREWGLVEGAVQLVVDAYPDKDSVASRMFHAARETIIVMHESLEFVGD